MRNVRNDNNRKMHNLVLKLYLVRLTKTKNSTLEIILILF